MGTKPPPELMEALSAFDDDALVKMMLAQFAEGFPDFASGGERMKSVADRAREIVRSAWDVRKALEDLSYSMDDLTHLRRSLKEPPALLGMNGIWETAERRLEAAQKTLMPTSAADLMHPNGRCTCGGEGDCAWCKTFGRAS